MVVACLLATACASTAIRPGACSRADSLAYNSLLVAGAGVDQIHADARTGDELRLSNKVTVTFNVVAAAWRAYHDALCVPSPDALVSDAAAALAAVTDALATFHPIQKGTP